jgi:two-component system chemotaxis response regulator CheY
MRFTIRALLAELGHDVVGEAGDGESAVKSYAALRPDMVFLDMILPGKSGLEILDDLLRIEPGVRVVIITAVSQNELDRKLVKKGVAGIIRKPFSYAEFKESVGRLTGETP